MYHFNSFMTFRTGMGQTLDFSDLNSQNTNFFLENLSFASCLWNFIGSFFKFKWLCICFVISYDMCWMIWFTYVGRITLYVVNTYFKYFTICDCYLNKRRKPLRFV